MSSGAAHENGSYGDMEQRESRKRTMDAPGEGDSNKRTHKVHDEDQGTWPGNHGEEKSFFLKLLVPNCAVGAIMGKGGETIVQLQNDTGTVIKISKAREFFPGTMERVALVQGTEEAIVQAHDFIADKIYGCLDKTAPATSTETDRGNMHVKIVVPNSTAGLIIGKGGDTVRYIIHESGAWLEVSQKMTGGWTGAGRERVVSVAGTREQNRIAVRLIVQKIVEHPESSSCPRLSYPAQPEGYGPHSAGGPSAGVPASAPSAYAQQQQQAAPPHHHQQQQHQQQWYGRGAGEYAAAMQQYQWPQAMAASGYESRVTAVPQPVLQEGFQGQELQAVTEALDRLSRCGYSMKTLGVAADGTEEEKQGEAAPADGYGVEEVGTLELEVHESLIGAVLGKGGQTLMDYQEATGTRIQISRVGEFVPGTNNRRVTILGTAAARKAAEFLIRKRVGAEQVNRATSKRR
ncbi:RNA-binding protein Nova-1-like isoform X1 [Lethenteron reissneri]|uniref:RNA-binding protein Nova-1-like isoform X1 n=1 Tax=Lethenteron reissneri TaxID=7753 RepID=UPI002AB75297|nr:RNA-binding protein Nova-1-like isoform X1 [Lethenteron reissneri]